MPAIDYRAARSQLRLAEVLHLLGFAPRWRRGDQVRGACLLHRARTLRSRSFAAHLGRDLWYCFVCRTGGNDLDLWVAATHQELHAAVIDLCARLSRDVPWLMPKGGRMPVP